MNVNSPPRRPLVRKRLPLLALCLAAFIISLDVTIVNVALPSLVRQAGATTTDLQWVVDAYNLAFAALVLVAGSLSDRLGRKGMLLAGLGLFGAASLAGSLVTSTHQLIGARAVMGVGAAMMFPATLSLLTTSSPAAASVRPRSVYGAPPPESGSPWARSSADGCWSGSGGAASSCSWSRWRPGSPP